MPYNQDYNSAQPFGVSQGRRTRAPNPTQQQQPGRPNLAPSQQQQPGQQISTSITPTGIYPDAFTRQAGNLAAAAGIPGRADLMAQAGMDGVSSSSPMTQWNMGSNFANMLSQSLMAPQQISQQHGFANAQNVLQGQQGREQEALGWGRIGLQNQNNLLSMLAHLM